MFTSSSGSDNRQRNSGDRHFDPVCAFSPAGERRALGVVYRHRFSLWLDPRVIPLDRCCSGHACNLQLDCSSFRRALTSGRVQHSFRRCDYVRRCDYAPTNGKGAVSSLVRLVFAMFIVVYCIFHSAPQGTSGPLKSHKAMKNCICNIPSAGRYGAES